MGWPRLAPLLRQPIVTSAFERPQPLVQAVGTTSFALVHVTDFFSDDCPNVLLEALWEIN